MCSHFICCKFYLTFGYGEHRLTAWRNVIVWPTWLIDDLHTKEQVLYVCCGYYISKIDSANAAKPCNVPVLAFENQAKSIFTDCSLHIRLQHYISIWFFSPLFCSSDTMAWESKVSFRCSRGVSSTFLRLKVGAGDVTWSSLKNAHR